MNLAEWATLSEDEQRRKVAQWYKDGPASAWDYHDLATKAAKALENELKDLPEVMHVHVGGGETVDLIYPAIPVMLVLNVCTSLHGSSQVLNLPPCFAGFRVVHLNLGDKRDAFIKTLKCFF